MLAEGMALSVAELELRPSAVTQHPAGVGQQPQDPRGYSRDGLSWNRIEFLLRLVNDRPLFLETHGGVLRG